MIILYLFKLFILIFALISASRNCFLLKKTAKKENSKRTKATNSDLWMEKALNFNYSQRLTGKTSQ